MCLFTCQVPKAKSTPQDPDPTCVAKKEVRPAMSSFTFLSGRVEDVNFFIVKTAPYRDCVLLYNMVDGHFS